MTGDLNQLVEQLQQMGLGTYKELMPVLVTYRKGEALLSLSLTALFVLMTTGLFFMCLRFYKRESKVNKQFAFGASCLGFITIVTLLVIAVCFTHDYLSAYLWPEANIIMYILNHAG